MTAVDMDAPAVYGGRVLIGVCACGKDLVPKLVCEDNAGQLANYSGTDDFRKTKCLPVPVTCEDDTPETVYCYFAEEATRPCRTVQSRTGEKHVINGMFFISGPMAEGKLQPLSKKAAEAAFTRFHAAEEFRETNEELVRRIFQCEITVA